MKLSRAHGAQSDIAPTYTNTGECGFALVPTSDRRTLLLNAALVTAFDTRNVYWVRVLHQIGMEEKESRDSEPGVQTESLSLIITDEGEEASPPNIVSAQLASGNVKPAGVHSQSVKTDGRLVCVCRVNPANEQ